MNKWMSGWVSGCVSKSDHSFNRFLRRSTHFALMTHWIWCVEFFKSLIKMTPTLLCSGAQWFDIQDHDEASTFLPVPMRRRHTLSPRLLPPINEGNFRSGSALVWLTLRGHLTSSAVERKLIFVIRSAVIWVRSGFVQQRAAIGLRSRATLWINRMHNLNQLGYWRCQAVALFLTRVLTE